MDKKERIIIVGQSGSGKDYLLRSLVERGMNPAIKYTTRPIRVGEVQGQTYNYITNEEFAKMVERKEMLYYQDFDIKGDIWYYGVAIGDYLESKVAIMTPREIQMLNESSFEDNRSNCIIYLDIDEKTRRDRILERADYNDSIERRLESDRIDFLNFRESNIAEVIITDPMFNVDDILSFVF